MGSLINITNLEKRFAEKLVLKDINLTIRKAERIAVLGPSGAGKTTLLRIISGLEKSTSGNVALTSSKISYVFQEPRLIPWRTVEKNLLFVRSKADLTNILGKIKLADFRHHYPHQLSGGMKQRVNLARALITNPDLLILDEAFSSLDLPIKLGLIDDLLSQWQEKQFTLIVVTHDLKEALLLADKVLIMSANPGEIAEEILLDLEAGKRNISDANLLRHEADILQILSGV